jgi:hypothetical protein
MDSCFVCPIHKPKFHDGLKLLKSYHEYYKENNLFFVFSNQEESDQFKEIANGLEYNSIIFNPLSTKDIQTRKKFAGLLYIYKNTDFKYVATIDADTEFFKNLNYDILFKQYYKTGRLFGNYFDRYVEKNKHFVNIVESPFIFFKKEDEKKIRKKTNNCQFYFWYNDIPVYEKNYFLNMIEYINYFKIQEKIDWQHFDFFLYAYYLIKEDVLKPTLILDAEKGIMIEDQYEIDEELFKTMFKKTKPMWIKNDIDEDLMINTFMHVHLDRLAGKDHVTTTF